MKTNTNTGLLLDSGLRMKVREIHETLLSMPIFEVGNLS